MTRLIAQASEGRDSAQFTYLYFCFLRTSGRKTGIGHVCNWYGVVYVLFMHFKYICCLVTRIICFMDSMIGFRPGIVYACHKGSDGFNQGYVGQVTGYMFMVLSS